jgi:aldehyde:ferredoxin oxidoreductase
MFGWMGKILRVDLTCGTSRVEEMPGYLMAEYIGGRGMAVKILYDEIDPGIDALSPDNKLIFATGPLTGTGAPAASRFVVSAKSPLSNGIAHPVCGGYFGINLKASGYDLLIVEGKSPEPVWLEILDDQVSVRSAVHLWGKMASDTGHAIKAGMKDRLDEWQQNALSVVSIGPAGENRVKFACVMADSGRAAGRSGLGAVMGAKNLKAVSALGTGDVSIADVEGFCVAIQGFYKSAGKAMVKRRMNGTWYLPGRANASKSQATHNFQEGYSPEFVKYEDFRVIRKEIRVRDEACANCPFACGKRSRIKDPDYLLTAKGPEHESMALLGTNCGVFDLKDIWRANYLCNELGLDTITTGSVISCAMELFEEGLLPEKDLGYSLPFGSPHMLQLLKQIANREGIGDLMAEGGELLAATYGRPELFMGVKGLGLPAWHPQAFDALGLQYATSNVGGCHTQSILPFYEGRKDPAGYVKWTKKDQDYLAMIDSGVMCWMIYHGPEWAEKQAQWLTLITGTGYTLDGLNFLGERVWNLERLFNLRAGLTGADDTLPARITREPRVKDRVVDLEKLLPQYYRLRGWDESGVPTREKLKALNLEAEGVGVI